MTDSFGDITLFDESGNRVAIRRMWQEQTAVLVFVRHLG